MRIGIDARMYGAVTTTGIGVYIQSLIQQLRSLDTENHYVIFLRPEAAKFFLPSERMHVVVADIPWYSWAEQWRLPKMLKAQRLDLVHFPHFNVPLLYFGKFVVTIHDITPKFFPGSRVRRSPIRKFAYAVVMHNALRRALRIITISEHTKRLLLRYYRISAKRISVIPLGVSADFRPTSDAGRLAQVLAQYSVTAPYLLYVGVWRDHKNIPGLVRAFELLRQRGMRCQLVIAGQPDSAYPEIPRAIAQSRFMGDIRTLGFVAQEKLPALYQGAGALVLPSFSEGFGLVAIEAAACGTLVAASKTTSVPEVMGDAALYFDPGSPTAMADVLGKCLTDPTLRSQLATRGRERVRRYNWKASAQATLAVYRNC